MFPLLLVLALWPKHVHEVFDWMITLGYVSIFFWLILPFILLVLARIRIPERRERKHRNS